MPDESTFGGGSLAAALYENGLLSRDELQRMLEHERAMEREESQRANRGQQYAFVLAIAFLLVCGSLIALGRGVEGTILLSFDLVALVTVFIAGRSGRKR